MPQNPLDVTGKAVLITGGNSGIGLGIAHALASSGANVCLWGRSKEKNAQACKALEACAGRVKAVSCDVSDEDQVEQAFEETLQEMGRVDACFANAGVGGRMAVKSFMEMSAEEWRRVLRINLDGAFFTLRAAARHMAAREGGGSLVATASLAAVEGQARGEHYAASKGGLISVVRGLAVEMARYGVRANVLLPGWIESEMTKEVFQTEAFQTKVLRRVPARRWGTPADFAGIAVYLASEASAYHTGDTFVIDGGYSLF
jgi:hypothetical protein